MRSNPIDWDVLLKGSSVWMDIAVAWGDMDAFNHVNNTVYLRWFESVRIRYFERVGWIEAMEATGVGPILAKTSCTYRAPLTYPDTVRIGVRAVDVGEDRFTHEHRVVSHRLKAVVAFGEGRIISFDYKAGMKAPIPETVRSAIDAMETRGEG